MIWTLWLNWGPQVITQKKSGSCNLCIILPIYTYLGLNDRYNAQAAVSIAIACFQNVINRLEDWHTDYLHSPPRPHARSGGDITLATFKIKPFNIFYSINISKKSCHMLALVFCGESLFVTLS